VVTPVPRLESTLDALWIRSFDTFCASKSGERYQGENAMKGKTQLSSPKFTVNTGAVIVIALILPEKAEAWRRFMQELSGSRRHEYEASRRRLGIRAERAWISETRQRANGIILIEADDVQAVLAALASSNHTFDCWFREQLRILQGFDLTHPNPAFLPDPIFAWRDNQKGDQQS
jgi:hypothetical protein